MLAYRTSETERRSLASGPLPLVKDPGSTLGPADFASCVDRMKETLVRTVELKGQEALNPHCFGALPKEGRVVHMGRGG